MKKHAGAILWLFVAFSCACPMWAEDYGRFMERKVKEALGPDSIRGYKFASYPVNNFGAATAYDKKVDGASEICATWTCLVDDDSQIPTDPDKQLKLVVGTVRYADIGAGAKNLTLSDDEKRSLGLKAFFPQLLKVLNINANYDPSTDLKTDLKLGPVTIRKLVKDRMLTRIKSLPNDSSEKSAFQNGRLVLVYSDIVASTMSIKITVDATKNADLSAKLDGVLSGKVGQVIGKGAGFEVKVDNAQKGDYSLEVSEPVVLAVYTKKQPQAGVLGKKKDWSDWPDESVPDAANKLLQQTVDGLPDN